MAEGNVIMAKNNGFAVWTLADLKEKEKQLDDMKAVAEATFMRDGLATQSEIELYTICLKMRVVVKAEIASR